MCSNSFGEHLKVGSQLEIDSLKQLFLLPYLPWTWCPPRVRLLYCSTRHSVCFLNLSVVSLDHQSSKSPSPPYFLPLSSNAWDNSWPMENPMAPKFRTYSNIRFRFGCSRFLTLLLFYCLPLLLKLSTPIPCDTTQLICHMALSS